MTVQVKRIENNTFVLPDTEVNKIKISHYIKYNTLKAICLNI